MTKVFIDGQAGTTGLQITERLCARADIELLRLDDRARKEPSARAARFQEADIAILCLPDAAAREAVALAGGHTRILDASTAHRVHDDWVYGLPELPVSEGTPQREKIAEAQYVSNPGCYPQGFILLVRPLIQAGLLAPTIPLTCFAVSGYSGGGRQMIERHNAFDSATAEALASQAYALTLEHKHVPEMHRFSTTAPRPLFAPQVAHYYKGMLVNVPLHAAELTIPPGAPLADTLVDVLTESYSHETFIDVLNRNAAPFREITQHGYLNATACNDTNRMELMVFGNEEQVLLTARYDNLGKGAAGAAVQNLNLMLGHDEGLGL